MTAHLSQDNDQYAAIQNYVNSLNIKVPDTVTEVDMNYRPKKQMQISSIEDQAQLAYAKLENLRERISTGNVFVHKLTLEDLRRSSGIRSLILDYDIAFLVNDPSPLGSF